MPKTTTTSTTNSSRSDPYNGFSANALLVALAPQAIVLQAWHREQQQQQQQQQHDNGSNHHAKKKDASLFAAWIQGHLNTKHTPPQRYLTHLVRLYVQDSSNDEDEDLMALYGVLQGTTRAVPNAMEYGYATYTIPTSTYNSSNNNNNSTVPLCIRIYPYHPDVSLRLWEAGAALAEFLVQQSSPLGTVMELGAGVGATALCLVAAGLADYVVATDYTALCLENLRHNFDVQQNPWLANCSRHNGSAVMAAHLDWNDYGNNDYNNTDNKDNNTINGNHQAHPDAVFIQQEMTKANLLIAADVAYDTSVLPSLARTVKRFLTTNTTTNRQQPKRALFATTKRNAATFQQLQDLLVQQQGLTCQTVVATTDSSSSSSSSSLTPPPPPILFPAKFHQARHEVALWQLTYDNH